MNKFYHHIKNKYSFFIVGTFLVSLSIITGLLLIEWTENKRFIENQRRSVVKQLSTLRARLEGDLNAELLLTRSIITDVRINTDISEEKFFQIADIFFKDAKHIKNIGLAKGTVLTYVYPVKGNEKAIGLNYQELPSQWPAVKKVIEARKTVLAGPLTLVQGGVAIIGRSPIYVNHPASGSERYFGLLSVVIDIPSLFRAAGVEEIQSQLKLSIRGKDGLGPEGDVFFGPATLFDEEPVLMDVALPGGNWLMAASPAGGWAKTSSLVIYYRIAALATALFILILLFFQQKEINQRKKAEAEKETVIKELREALSEVKQLSGLLPICSSCKKIRDDKGYWNQIEQYISEHTEATFSHSICKDCSKKLYPELKINLE